MAKHPPALKRDLDFLLGSQRRALTEPVTADTNLVTKLPLTQLQPGQYQPRRAISEDSIKELAASIAEHGVLQPIIARPLPAVDGGAPQAFEIIAGERRWRASQQAGLKELPVIIRSIDDNTALALGLIENMQRENLTPLEEALGLQRLIEEFGLSHQKAADAVGKSRSMVSNLLRLLQLSPIAKQVLEAGNMEMGHARALLSLPAEQQDELAMLIQQQNLSVREIESRVRHWLTPKSATTQPAPSSLHAPAERLAKQLAQKLNVAVRFKTGKKSDSGQLIISYRSAEELANIMATLT